MFDIILVVLFVIFISVLYVCILILHEDSFSPTFANDKFILVYKRSQSLNYGDVILLEDEDGNKLMKHIIGLPGDRIETVNGKVVLNGETLDESYIVSEDEYFEPITVADDSYFVLGDNRSDSIDSRNFRCVSKDQIIGIVKE